MKQTLLPNSCALHAHVAYATLSRGTMFGNLSSIGSFPAHYTDEGLPFENRKVTIVGLIATFLVLAWICVGLRVYTRVCVVRTPGWDDFVVVIALVGPQTRDIASDIRRLT
ncbi:hypothetical protein LZ31DRAFT_541807 [Colletotrichum somersetense]|nr:hypothetical protein LZ31DRAFT_541807 [Colletotrichum somersetense]